MTHTNHHEYHTVVFRDQSRDIKFLTRSTRTSEHSTTWRTARSTPSSTWMPRPFRPASSPTREAERTHRAGPRPVTCARRPRYLLCSPEPSGTGWLACRARYDSLPPVVDDPGGVVTGSR